MVWVGEINLLSDVSKIPAHNLLIQISKRENNPFEKKLEKLYEKFMTISKNVKLTNVNEEYFWTDRKVYYPRLKNLEKYVIQWLTK